MHKRESLRGGSLNECCQPRIAIELDKVIRRSDIRIQKVCTRRGTMKSWIYDVARLQTTTLGRALR